MIDFLRFIAKIAGATGLVLLLLPQVGRCDDIMWLESWSPIFTLIALVLIVEPLVIFYETWYLQGALELPRDIALEMSIWANLVSFLLGGALQYFWGFLASGLNSGSMGGAIGGSIALQGLPVFVLISIGLSCAIEYPVLRSHDHGWAANAPLLMITLRMNAISVSLAYVLLGLLTLIWTTAMSILFG